MNEQTVYWVYIQQALGFSSSKLKNVLKSYRYADDFFYASVEEKLTADRFTDTESKNIRKASLEKAQEIIEQCKLGGIDIVSYGDDAYPDILRRISDPPAVLYVQGDVSVFKQHLHIAVVGTRSATYWGKKSAYDISYQLSNGGACVVSGGAMGIDSQAHLGAVEGAGKTICVLGCGHNSGYLKFNVSLKNRISQNGAVISEFPPSASPSKYTFPMRNRIISGLSEGTLVIEAGEGSGSLITARYAFEQNRGSGRVRFEYKRHRIFWKDIHGQSPIIRKIKNYLMLKCMRNILIYRMTSWAYHRLSLCPVKSALKAMP